jgi:hypothetical protein
VCKLYVVLFNALFCSLVRLYPFSNQDPELMEEVLMHIDLGNVCCTLVISIFNFDFETAIQFGEDAEPKQPDEEEGDDEYIPTNTMADDF